jgi:hypothetical protein
MDWSDYNASHIADPENVNRKVVPVRQGEEFYGVKTVSKNADEKKNAADLKDSMMVDK